MPTVNNPGKDLALTALDYSAKKEQIKTIESECRKLRTPLETYVKQHGKTAASGSLYAVLPYADKDVVIKETLRVSKVMLPEAIDVLKANGYGECIEMVPIVREDVLACMYEDGKIPDELLAKLYEPKSTYAFSVEVKKRFDGED